MGEPVTPAELSDHEAIIYNQRGGGDVWTFVRGEAECAVTIKGRLRTSAAEGVREAVFAGIGVAIGSEWMFAPEITTGKIKRILHDWSLPPVDLWAVLPTGRNASTKARAFASFIEQELRADHSLEFVDNDVDATSAYPPPSVPDR
jgi:DNA-binding transcriptional LysR family regulator